MAWADLVESANAAFLSTWGIAATLIPQAGSGPVQITGIIKNPGIEEQFLPGSAAGPAVVRFWVDYNTISPQPKNGDGITINGMSYSIGKPPEVDVEGGAVLHLRQNG